MKAETTGSLRSQTRNSRVREVRTTMCRRAFERPARRKTWYSTVCTEKMKSNDPIVACRGDGAIMYPK